MSIETEEELAALKAAGRVVAEAIRAMRREVRAGISTLELDQVGGRVFARAGARSGPQLDYGFPGINCISVNDEAVHGIPGKRRLQPGDLLKLDVTAELNGFYADACVSVPVDDARPSTLALIAAGRAALTQALQTASAGTRLNDIGRTIENAVEKRGYHVCRDLMGHGIGRRIHEWPHVPNYDAPGAAQPLTEGLVITIEPIISAGSGQVRQSRDGWTITTADGARSVHVERTLVVTQDRPVLLTV